MRNLLSTCAIALAIVCATHSIHAAEPAAAAAEPAPTATPTPTADATPAESATPAAEAQTAAIDEATKNAEFERVAKSYRQVEKDGQKLYCRNEKRLGTRLGAPVCLTEAQLWERIHKAEEVRDDMRGPRNGACGSSAAVC